MVSSVRLLLLLHSNNLLSPISCCLTELYRMGVFVHLNESSIISGCFATIWISI
eukprot:SAG31_NODE_60_length_29419_cov_39.876398_18_plen_54_part_00